MRGYFIRKCRHLESLIFYLNNRNGVKDFAGVINVNVRFYRSLYTKPTFRLLSRSVCPLSDAEADRRQSPHYGRFVLLKSVSLADIGLHSSSILPTEIYS